MNAVRSVATAAVLMASFAATSGCQREGERKAVQSSPLNEYSQAEGKRFTLVPGELSGVDFVHQWTPTTDETKILFDGPFAGGGVCIGDYDGDGLPDLFLTRPFGGNRLYRNLGGLRFEDRTQSAGLSFEMDRTAWGAGPTFADINNDGHLDLYVCAYGQPNRLYINRGDGSFSEEAAAYGLDFDGASVTMAFADYDVDGDLDGYLVTYRKHLLSPPITFTPELRAGRYRVPKEYQEIHDIVLRPPNNRVILIPAGQLDHLYRNENGRFRDVTQEALGNAAEDGYWGLSARWWDFNADGYPDLYVSNDFFGPDQLFLNKRDGTFAEVTRSVLPYTPWFSMGSDAGDINNDGRLDFMAADMSATTHYKSKLNMGDMNDSGWFLDSAEPRQYMSNALYLNTGTDRFQEVSSMAGVSSSDWSWALKFADFDLDGNIDVYLTNGMTRNWFNSDLRSRTSEGSPEERKTWLEEWEDKPRLDERNVAFRNEGDLKFSNAGAEWGLDHEGVSFGSALGDLDGDGDLDVVTVNFDEAVAIYRNDTAGKHRLSVRLVGGTSNRYGIGASIKIEHEGIVQIRDLATSRGFFSADEPLAHFGLGDSEKVERLTVKWPGGGEQVITNLEAGRHYTIHEQSLPPKQVVMSPMFRAGGDTPDLLHVESEFDDFKREPLLPNRMSRFGPGLACADVNEDGRVDFFLAGSKDHPGQLVVSHGEGFRRANQELLEEFMEREEMGGLFFDADGDGDSDLYISCGGVECDAGSAALQDQLLLNDGTGGFSRAPSDALPEIRDSGGVVTAADFDRDGDLDLFVGGRSVPGNYPETPTSHLLRNDGGKFRLATPALAPGLSSVGLVTSALWSDMDGDGWTDLLVTTEWGPVCLFRNASGQLVDETEKRGLARHTGWWNGISGRDIDNDGDIDYVATNFGTNNKYQPTSEKPVVLYYGDMAGDGDKTIVEAKYHDQQLLPVRGKSCSTNAMPHLANKFRSFHEFASASLTEIYPNTLESADRFEATVLDSGVFRNEGEKGFVFEPLPRISQVSPGFGVAATDVNADGMCDIYFVQNFYHPQRETVRMSAGVSQLLIGDGTGTFAAEPVYESGLLVPGDARGLSVADLNGDQRPDFVISQNDDRMLAFTNEVENGFVPVCIELRGNKGNPEAIGARVTLQVPNLPDQTAEVYAGGSYLSQSTSSLFFGGGKGPGEEVQVRVAWPDGKVSTTVSAIKRPILVIHPDVSE